MTLLIGRAHADQEEVLIVPGRHRVPRPDIRHHGDDVQRFRTALPELQHQGRRLL